ncbi:hypothetical protein [Actinomycetospora sp. CA-053990]|uniref:hypothetical protein n=1 Tax=Actinomycetospora sp. CA-053990 TaxID=3239891 RepID=UPI003D908AE2
MGEGLASGVGRGLADTSPGASGDPSTSVPAGPRDEDAGTGMIPAWSLTSPALGTRNAAVRGADGAARTGPSGSDSSGRRRRRTAASGMRSAGSLTIRPRMTSTTGPRPVGTGTSPCTTSVTVPTGSPASYGGRPSRQAKRVAPSPQRSAAGPTARPIATSGAM